MGTKTISVTVDEQTHQEWSEAKGERSWREVIADGVGTDGNDE